MADYSRFALLVSDSQRAQEVADRIFRPLTDWVAPEEAEVVVVIGGDGFMLQSLHTMLDTDRIIPAYGVNLGTIGFLMNRNRQPEKLLARIARAKKLSISPLSMEAVTQNGHTQRFCAINEVSLLRETRQTAKIEVLVDDKVRIKELVCDGVLLSTPAGSTAYNLSADGPILPLDSNLLALTPISAFRPRRWKGAILPDRSCVTFRVIESDKRPVAAVADQRELRDVAEVRLEIARNKTLTLLFDPGHSLDERIVSEQFQF